MAATRPVQILVLGPPQVEVAGRPVVLGSARQQALVAFLAMHANTVVSTEQIADALWGEAASQSGANAVQTYVSRLRRALGDGREVLVTRAPGYALVVGDDDVDARRFERLCRAARDRSRADPSSAVRLLDEALALWRGRAYAPFEDGFARADATRLEELRVVALEQRAALALELGEPGDAVARARELVSAHPLREHGVEILMRALHESGQTPEALAVYQQHRRMLDLELGLSPSAAVQALESDILRDEVPAPRTGAAAAATRDAERSSSGSLPWRPSELIGRQADLDRVRGALRGGAVLTLTGTGGVGKTRIALEVVHERVLDGHAVWWVDLAPVPPGGVVRAVAEATGVETASDDDRGRHLCLRLRARQGVLCLDNAEHVLDEVAAVVEGLQGSALAVLVTSRERLRVDRELVHTVAPLSTSGEASGSDPAVRLFLARWQRPTGDSTPPGPEESSVVSRLCRDLDGLPLAIELAAARASALGLSAVADRIGSRLDLLGAGRRTGVSRHETLRAVVDWSYALLTSVEAELLTRLAVFPGSFALDQVEAVCGGDGLDPRAVAHGLSRLIEQSLVQVAPDRFWLLDTIRVYAAERLDEPTLHRLRGAHAHDSARRLQAAARQLWTSAEPDAVAAITALLPDLHAAWRYALDHDVELAAQLAADVFGFAYVRQRLDMLRWSATIASRGIEHPRMPEILAAAATAEWASRHLDRAHELTARAIALAGGPDQPAAAMPLDISADLAMFEGRTEDAVAGYRAVAALHRDAGRSGGEVLAEVAAAQAQCYGPDWREVAPRMDGLLRRARATGNPTTLAFAHFVAGEAAARSDRDAALAAYAAASRHGAAADSRLFVLLARSARAAWLSLDAEPQQAAEAFVDVLRGWEEIDNEAGLWSALQSLVPMLVRLRPADAAVLAGAVQEHASRRWTATFGLASFDSAIASLRRQLSGPAVDALLHEGAQLSLSQTLAHAREALTAVLPAPVSEPYAT